MTFQTDYRRGRHVVSVLHVRLVFVTKYRRGVLDEAMLRCCEDAMRKVCGDFGAELREFNGEDDHVHLLVEYPPKVPVSALVNSLKGVSARKLRAQFTGRVNRHTMHGHLWSPSYFAASCGGAPPSIIRQYIEQQRRPVKAASGLTLL
jgi:putative transposase